MLRCGAPSGGILEGFRVNLWSVGKVVNNSQTVVEMGKGTTLVGKNKITRSGTDNVAAES